MGKTGDTNRHQSLPEMCLRPVGSVVRREENEISKLVVDSELSGILDGIDDFSHLLVLFWAHQVPSERRSQTQVHPRGREDLPLTGIFATRSPARPNPICITPVKLLRRTGNTLEVQGLDALDGSPIIDIKPHFPGPYAADEVSLPDWWYK